MMTDDEVERLCYDARAEGDRRLVYLCLKALAGNKTARRMCANAVADKEGSCTDKPDRSSKG